MASNNTPPNPNQARSMATANPNFASPPMSQLSHLRPPPQPQSSTFQFSLQSQQFQSPNPQNPTPSSNPNKRPPQKPPTPSFKSSELAPAARRKKRKLPDKQIPDRVAALLPESALYTQLLEFESRVDAALARKKVDIQESLKNPPSLQRTLRIYVFNTFSVAKNGEPASWSLKIIGRVLEDGVVDNDNDPARVGNKPNPMYPKFSCFFKRVTVTLDPALYPENSTIVWENSRSPAPLEGFEIKRKGDNEFNVGIKLEMHYSPEKFKLSPALTELLGIEVDTRARIIAGIWHYVKAKKLQNPSDPTFFTCDPPLKKVFGEDKVKFASVSQKISQHLSHPQPIMLEHRIRVSGNGVIGNACYDVLVDVPFPLQKEMAAFLSNTEKHKEIEACDEVICASIKKIHEHRRRRAFFLGFSQSPVEFINALIASQSRDLKLVAGEASRNTEKERRSDFYNQPWVEDAVIRYLNRKPAGGTDAPGST